MNTTTTTFTLRKLLMAARLGISIISLEENVTFTNVVEDDLGFDADWEVTPAGAKYLLTLVGVGVVIAAEQA